MTEFWIEVGIALVAALLAAALVVAVALKFLPHRIRGTGRDHPHESPPNGSEEVRRRIERVRDVQQRVEALRAEAGDMRAAQEEKLLEISSMSREEARRELVARVEEESKEYLEELRRDLLEIPESRIESRARATLLAAMQRIGTTPMSEETSTTVAPPQRRDEGPPDRPGGPQHPQLRIGDRRVAPHRRNPRHGSALGLRPRPPGDRPGHPRVADQGRADPPRQHRGKAQEGDGRDGDGGHRSRRGSHSQTPPVGRTPRGGLPARKAALPAFLQPEHSRPQRGGGLSLLPAGLGNRVRSKPRQEGGPFSTIWARPSTTSSRAATPPPPPKSSGTTTSPPRSSMRSPRATRRSVPRAPTPGSSCWPTPSPPPAPARARTRPRATSSGCARSRPSPRGFDGVRDCYALQAGREIRVIVDPDNVPDEVAKRLALRIRNRIESELQYPSTIKVTVIRESRFQETAK